MYFYLLALPAPDNNNTVYVIIVILVLISLLTFSSIYTQNREMKEKLKNKSNKENESTIPNEPLNVYQENVITEDIKEDKQDLIEEVEEENVNFIEEIEEEHADLEANLNLIEEIKEMNLEEIEEPKTPIEEPKLVELTEMKIPDKLEYTQALWQNDFLDLESISKELENNQKEAKKNMTPFEAEQEEKAIISYDELINRTESSKDYDSETISKPVVSKLSTSEKNQQDEVKSYEHEEAFLDDLKNLKDSLVKDSL